MVRVHHKIIFTSLHTFPPFPSILVSLSHSFRIIVRCAFCSSVSESPTHNTLSHTQRHSETFLSLSSHQSLNSIHRSLQRLERERGHSTSSAFAAWSAVMDAREPPRPQPPSIMGGPTSYAPTNIGPNSSGAVMMAPATARFPFGVVPPPQQQPPPASEPFPVSPSAAYDGSSSPMKPCSLAKKKRGRPRKYSPDGNIALGLAPTHTSPPPPSSAAASGGGIGGDSAVTASADASAKKHRGRPPGSGKKQLDALGSCCCFCVWFFCLTGTDCDGSFLCWCEGAGGVGFTPHVILVESGEVMLNKN